MHTIKFVAHHTGLSPHVIRAWERRYSVLSPERTPTNRRLYSEEDITKLALLQRVVQAGHSIGQVANLSVPELQKLLRKVSDFPMGLGIEGNSMREVAETPYVEDCLRSIERLDMGGLENTLIRATATLGVTQTMEHILVPLLHQIGERWQEGELRPAHEHMATAVIRNLLGRTLASFQPSVLSPCLVVSTPVGQRHELGALIVAITATSVGWRVLYLGADLPAEEIAGATLQGQALAVALSIVFPPDDPRLSYELTMLRSLLGHRVPILVGGRATSSYLPELRSVGALVIEDLLQLRRQLELLRSSATVTSR
jgi:DNA-binding transcriptional MerR regulator/methylmalonyl-CoA mutase cobalamin-binding subunit